ncbi:MAG TPA: hypothetical protein DGR97_14575 [Gammaproteobacteria bacterium]|nr:hypothetical protein [Gammaproteobacteria bacterium]|tara:strand:- start:456 stop:1229 length:774 start_codon:yes stop_codon:yes gene_type:complete
MCILLTAHAQHSDYCLIIAANRDEFYTRPSAAANWDDQSGILGGRDLECGGTWLGVNRFGAFSAITNIPKPAGVDAPRSRGLIVRDFLSGKASPSIFFSELAKRAHCYAGFNALAWNGNSLMWYSNQLKCSQKLPPGVYGLSNHLLDTPWPKVTRIKADFKTVNTLTGAALVDALFSSLANDRTEAETGSPDNERADKDLHDLTPIFIAGDSYGTRCSTVILVSHAGRLTLIERRFGPRKLFLGESKFEFELNHGPT